MIKSLNLLIKFELSDLVEHSMKSCIITAVT